MATRHGVASSAAGAVTAGLAVLLLDVALESAYLGYVVAAGAGFVAAVLAVIGLLLRASFEARLSAVVVSAMAGVLALLGMILGAPGAAGGSITLRGLLFVGAGIAVPALLAVDARARAARHPTTRPYAR